MPVFALYNFNDNTAVIDSAVENGLQNGTYINGATALGGDLILDGINDFAKIRPDAAFQMPRGTLEINFTTGNFMGTGPQTVLSRDSVGENAGSYRVEVFPNGQVVISHEAEGATTSFSTAPGFFTPGDTLNLTYSWDEGGTGGVLQLENTTQGTSYEAPVPAGLSMDMADQSQPWIVGAGQSSSDPDLLNNINQYFSGTVEFFSLSDTVDNAPETPVANPDTAVTDEDTAVTIPVLENDTDPNGDPLFVTGGSATNGSVTVNPDGTLRYVPNADYNGTDTITYTIRDPAGNTATSTVTVTVRPVNDAPVANDDTASTTVGAPVTIPVLLNDSDVDGDALSITGTPTSAEGSVSVNPDGTLTFTPNAGFTGTATIAYSVTDPSGATDDATVTVTVTGSGRDGIVTGTDGNDVIDTTYVDPTDGDRVDANDALIPGDGPNDDRIVGGGGNDTVTAGDGNDTVSGGDGDDVLRGDGPSPADLPDRSYPGLYAADLFPDNNRDSLDGGAGNDLLQGGDDADTLSGGIGDDTLDGGIDADVITGGDGADRVIGGEGSDTVDGGAGNDTIYGGTDGAAADPLNLADTTSDLDVGNNRDNLVGGEGDDLILGLDDDDTIDGGAGNDTLSGGLDDDLVTGGAGNDLIAGGQGEDTLTGGADRDTFTEVTAGDVVDGSSEGDDFDTLDLRGLGPVRIDYSPDDIEDGTVTFLDGSGNATGSMTFVEIENILTDDALPIARPDTATTAEDTPVTIDVLVNDTDPDGSPLTVISASAPNGTVDILPDGSLRYSPAANFNGPDTITYTVRDADGNTATTTVAVTVTPENDDPVANPDTETTAFNTPVTVAVLSNDTDADGDTLSFVGTPTSADGTVAVNPDGTLTFTPNPGFSGDAVVTYTITDGNGGEDTTTLTITVLERPRDGIVRGTEAGELIDTAYIDPFDADRVDANDAIVPGDGPNDDRIVAGGGNDTVIAGPGNDTVNGDLGDDSVLGGTGNDELRGNEGNDTLTGGDGRDTIFGQQDDDLIDSSSGVPLPDIDYPGFYAADADPENDRDIVYGGLGNDTIRTGDDADTVFGDDGRDLIDSGVDADSVFGGQGADTIIGNEGADTIDGGMSDDLIYGGLDDSIGEALDILDATDLRPGNNRDSLLGNSGDDTIFGRDDDDTLYGGTGADVLDGGIDEDSVFGDEGNDTILGGQGADTMVGGDDRDVFLIRTEEQGQGDVIDGSEGGDDFDILDLRGSGPLRVIYDADNVENGRVDFRDASGNVTSTLSFVNIENVIPCFTPGTLVATPKGEVPVELLREGDKVITRDNGIQEIRWTGAKALTWNDFRLNPHLRPVLIRKGSLGNGLPEQDMMVSPNHRMLVANDRTALYFDEHEVLVSAKHLVGGQGVQVVDSVGTTYIHFMFDRHEVVLANGAWTESFQPGDYTLKGMGNAQRNEILELFPELKSPEGIDAYTAARRTLKRHEARLLVR